MINGDARTVVKEGCHIPGVAGVELVEVRFEDGVGDGSKRWRGRNGIGTKARMGIFGLGRSRDASYIYFCFVLRNAARLT